MTTQELTQTIVEHIIIKLNESYNTKVSIIEDKNEIKNYIQDIWNILTNSYKDKGGFKTAQTPNHLLKSIDLVKLVFNKTTIVACATYRNLNGFKMTGIGCIPNEIGKQGLESIIQHDINYFKDWYWAEVSDAVEHYFKKNNGYPIPNIYAPYILKKDIELIDDDIHYKREIGVDKLPYIKAIYGFPSKEMYDKVLSEINNYDNFRNRINKINESSNLYSKDVNKAITIIANIVDYHFEDGFNELTPYWYKCLLWAIEVLTQKPYKDKFQTYIDKANQLLNEMPILNYIQFN